MAWMQQGGASILEATVAKLPISGERQGPQDMHEGALAAQAAAMDGVP